MCVSNIFCTSNNCCTSDKLFDMKIIFDRTSILVRRWVKKFENYRSIGCTIALRTWWNIFSTCSKHHFIRKLGAEIRSGKNLAPILRPIIVSEFFQFFIYILYINLLILKNYLYHQHSLFASFCVLVTYIVVPILNLSDLYSWVRLRTYTSTTFLVWIIFSHLNLHVQNVLVQGTRTEVYDGLQNENIVGAPPLRKYDDVANFFGETVLLLFLYWNVIVWLRLISQN